MTYSIIGRDRMTGELGIAVQSRFFAAGRLVPWIEADVGAIASQAFAEPRYGYEGLTLLKRGATPQAATSAFAAEQGALADRLLASLEAAEREGGDIRGVQAAALIVVNGSAVENVALGRVVDLRIDDHADPVGELRRQLAYARAHQQAVDAMAYMQAGDIAGALTALEAAINDFPDEPTFLGRYALALMASGDLPGARAAMMRAGPRAFELVMRMADAGIVPVPRAVLAALAP